MTKKCNAIVLKVERREIKSLHSNKEFFVLPEFNRCADYKGSLYLNCRFLFQMSPFLYLSSSEAINEVLFTFFTLAAEYFPQTEMSQRTLEIGYPCFAVHASQSDPC